MRTVPLVENRVVLHPGSQLLTMSKRGRVHQYQGRLPNANFVSFHSSSSLFAFPLTSTYTSQLNPNHNLPPSTLQALARRGLARLQDIDRIPKKRKQSILLLSSPLQPPSRLALLLRVNHQPLKLNSLSLRLPQLLDNLSLHLLPPPLKLFLTLLYLFKRLLHNPSAQERLYVKLSSKEKLP